MQETDVIKLTHYSHGGGCGCKISPQVLDEIIGSHAQGSFDNLLVGNDSRDDAAAIDIGDGKAIISTADFFMPIVDDAFVFGKVAAANAISDIYAMGGKPLMALGLLGWPIDKLPASLAGSVMAGAKQICAEAGIPLAGGHSIDSPEPIFGLSVTGITAVDRLLRNNTAKAGDVLFITKPVGVGILTTAAKRGLLLPEHEKNLTDQLTALNKFGEKLADIKGVSAVTDITGFGVAGHLFEMASGSGLTAYLDYSTLPKVTGVEEYIKQRIGPDATFRNWNAYGKNVAFEKGVDVMQAFQLLPDPQTNGGLLIAVGEQEAQHLVDAMMANGLEAFAKPVGKMMPQEEKIIRVFP